MDQYKKSLDGLCGQRIPFFSEFNHTSVYHKFPKYSQVQSHISAQFSYVK